MKQETEREFGNGTVFRRRRHRADRHEPRRQAQCVEPPAARRHRTRIRCSRRRRCGRRDRLVGKRPVVLRRVRSEGQLLHVGASEGRQVDCRQQSEDAARHRGALSANLELSEADDRPSARPRARWRLLSAVALRHLGRDGRRRARPPSGEDGRRHAACRCGRSRCPSKLLAICC